jgi:hypothetical protein
MFNAGQCSVCHSAGMFAPPAAPPSGDVTFLFTDVEGSTRQWETNAEGMRVALAEHYEALREAVEAHGGWLFKRTGDGVCAGVRLTEVRRRRRGRRTADTRVGGPDGHRYRRSRTPRRGLFRCGAQSCRAGDGRRARRSDPAGRFHSGPAQRSGLGGSGAAAVARSASPSRAVPGSSRRLRTEFPPLRALDSSAGNLMRPVTSFIGRDSEVVEVEAALRGHRLVTLTGVGGVGKTRLAVEVAARSADEFPDGV